MSIYAVAAKYKISLLVSLLAVWCDMERILHGCCIASWTLFSQSPNSNDVVVPIFPPIECDIFILIHI